jgi:sterol desaturase/sphingolipid hydroxylase (fatty acid hydroxylase superfamily)
MLQFTVWHEVVLVIAFRYFLVAGFFWTIWYVLLRRKVSFKKIQTRFPAPNDYAREIGYSLLTILIFAGVSSLLLLTPFRQYTAYYSPPLARGWVYFLLVIPAMFLLHDAYFYWTHRLMHHPKLFKIFHLVHHKSTNPSPWAAFAFHPLEALVEVGYFALMIMVLPISFVHIFIFFAVMIIYNVYGHLGWELYPKGFTTHRIGKWLNTSVNHNSHHQYFKGNYGLYFLWWDRWMGTLRTDYDEKFEEVKSRKAPTAEEVPAWVLQAEK